MTSSLVSKIPVDKKEFRWLIIANFMVLLGVLFDGWNIYQLLLIYWLETLFLGLLTLGKVAYGGWTQDGPAKGIFYSVFMVIHFGMFMLFHGGFISVFYFVGLDRSSSSSGFEKNIDAFIESAGLTSLPDFLAAVVTQFPVELAAFLVLAGRLLMEFLKHLREDQNKKFKVEEVMMEPYGRVVHMHVSIIFGGFALMASDFNGVYLAAVWVIIKSYLEWRTYRDPNFSLVKTK